VHHSGNLVHAYLHPQEYKISERSHIYSQPVVVTTGWAAFQLTAGHQVPIIDWSNVSKVYPSKNNMKVTYSVGRNLIWEFFDFQPTRLHN